MSTLERRQQVMSLAIFSVQGVCIIASKSTRYRSRDSGFRVTQQGMLVNRSFNGQANAAQRQRDIFTAHGQVAWSYSVIGTNDSLHNDESVASGALMQCPGALCFPMRSNRSISRSEADKRPASPQYCSFSCKATCRMAARVSMHVQTDCCPEMRH